MAFVDPNSLRVLQTQLTVPVKGAKCIPLNLDFSSDSSYFLSLQGVEAGAKIGRIQTIWIDASGSTADVSVTVGGSLQKIVAKAGIQGYYSVLAVNPTTLTFQCSGGPASLPIQLIDAYIHPVTWGQTSGGGSGGGILSGSVDPGTANPLLVQHTGANTNVVAFPGPVTKGNLLVAIARNNNSLPNPTPISDTLGNAWKQAAYGSGSNNSFPNQVSISYAIANAGGTPTVTAGTTLSLILAEFGGVSNYLSASGGTVRGVGGPPAPTLSIPDRFLMVTAGSYDGSVIGVTAPEVLFQVETNAAASYLTGAAGGSITSSMTAGGATNQGYASASFVCTGTGNPGVDGDLYLNEVTGVFWMKSSGVWAPIGALYRP